MREIQEKTGVPLESLDLALSRQPEMDGLAMEFVRAYFFLRSTTQSSGFGHNPISVEQYIGFAKLLLSGMITDVSCGVVMPGMVTVFHAADMKFLELEHAKQESKSSKSSSRAPKIT